MAVGLGPVTGSSIASECRFLDGGTKYPGLSWRRPALGRADLTGADLTRPAGLQRGDAGDGPEDVAHARVVAHILPRLTFRDKVDLPLRRQRRIGLGLGQQREPREDDVAVVAERRTLQLPVAVAGDLGGLETMRCVRRRGHRDM